jgi:hypothetical protein
MRFVAAGPLGSVVLPAAAFVELGLNQVDPARKVAV